MSRNKVRADWYRPTLEKPFFGEFYYWADRSEDGFLDGRKLTYVERTHREVDGVIRLLALKPEQGHRILDAPCGYGRHLLELAHRGYRMTGLDLCPTYIETVRANLEKLGVVAATQVGELQALPFPAESFDVVLNLFFSFGFYAAESDNARSMYEFGRVLKPGGRLLLHTDVNLARVQAGKYKQPLIRNLEDGSVLRIFEEVSGKKPRMIGEWVVQSEDKHERRWYSMRVYSLQEFQELCAQAGLEVESHYGSFDPGQDEYTQDSEELIFIARKR